MLANLFWRIKRFKATKFQIEVLVAMNRWAEVGSLLYIICTLEHVASIECKVSENILLQQRRNKRRTHTIK